MVAHAWWPVCGLHAAGAWSQCGVHSPGAAVQVINTLYVATNKLLSRDKSTENSSKMKFQCSEDI